jgi:putative hydrolase of the HAD superfamily
MKLKGVLFDLGNTLAEYYTRAEFPGVLEQAVSEVQSYLDLHGEAVESSEELRQRVQAENHEARNYRVRPLETRLTRIFSLANDRHLEGICRAFMKPIFALGRCYDDSAAVLSELRRRGLKIAIVSNAPWGSPSYLWREEIERLGLREHVDDITICTDIGWRKPARPIFLHTLSKLGLTAEDCVFVGDHPRWDVEGPRRVGMEAIIVDRTGTASGAGHIADLNELLARLKLST